MAHYGMFSVRLPALHLRRCSAGLRGLLSAALVIGSVLASRPVDACMVDSVSAVWPGEGDVDVPPDSALVFSWNAFNPASDWSGACVPDGFRVEVVAAATAEVVPGTLTRWDTKTACNGLAYFRWTPKAPLAASAEYDVSVEAADAIPDGGPPATWQYSFTTGTTATPPLQSSGLLSVALAAVKECRTTCMQPDACGSGGGCDTICEQQVQARVTVPPVTGGQARTGYDALLISTEGSPYEFGGSQSAAGVGFQTRFHGSMGGAKTVTVEVPISDTPITPCFAVEVWDPQGQLLVLPPVCLDPIATSQLLPGGDAGVPAEAPLQDDSDGCSCNTAGGARSAWTAFATWAGAMILAARRRSGSHRRSLWRDGRPRRRISPQQQEQAPK